MGGLRRGRGGRVNFELEEVRRYREAVVGALLMDGRGENFISTSKSFVYMLLYPNIISNLILSLFPHGSRASATSTTDWRAAQPWNQQHPQAA